MKFTKMHGIGNDYVYINCFEEKVEDAAALASAMSDRHFGVGADGLVLICPSENARVHMRVFNPDGSEAEMCGNAIRCVAKYAYEHGMTEETRFPIETGAGVKMVELRLEGGEVAGAAVDMGRPVFDCARIPVTGTGRAPVELPVTVSGMELKITAVGMGNPHCVIYVDDVDGFPVDRAGPLMEHHELFPNRTNVEFVQVLSRTELKQRTWERGAGETLACGTGASAALAASVLTGRTENKIINHLTGGDLELEWPDEEGSVFMTGPAVFVFEGQWPD